MHASLIGSEDIEIKEDRQLGRGKECEKFQFPSRWKMDDCRVEATHQVNGMIEVFKDLDAFCPQIS